VLEVNCENWEGCKTEVPIWDKQNFSESEGHTTSLVWKLVWHVANNPRQFLTANVVTQMALLS